MRGRSPRVIFVCPSPTRVGAAVVEVMGGDDLLGLRDCPLLPDSLPRRILHQLKGFVSVGCERNVHFSEDSYSIFYPPSFQQPTDFSMKSGKQKFGCFEQSKLHARGRTFLLPRRGPGDYLIPGLPVTPALAHRGDHKVFPFN